MPSPVDFTRTVRVIEEGFAEGLHLGAQVYVSRNGETRADLALGEAAPGIPMTPDTLLLWQSCTKPLVAVAAAQLWERGLLEWDDPVARFIPEFAANGKERVTRRHLLLHTAGFRFVMLRWFSQTWEENFQRMVNAPLEPGWTPGKKAGYHAATSWFILAEVLRRLDGRPVEDLVREEIFEPLGMMDSWLKMTAEQYYDYDERIGPLYDTAGGGAKPLDLVDSEDGATRVRPGSSGRGPARELGRFYEALLFRGARNGARILTPQTVEAMTARHRAGMYDETFKSVVDWGLGFIVDSKQYGSASFGYGFGQYASARTFGHGGHQSAISYCDPEAGLVVVVLTNGLPGEQAHRRRFEAVNAAIYEDVGIAG
jgi:CubicO group peptidase (beta-lactamase class C family)